MIDRFNRRIEYARISITDRCNLRCRYCMSENGIEKISPKDVLTYEEIIHVTKIFSQLGIKKIRLTGGEPLLRKNICELIAALKNINGIDQVTLTTNGILLSKYLENLISSGIDGINLSLDTLDAKIFSELTRRDLFSKVIESFQTLIDANFLNIKINSVLIHGINDREILKLVELAKNNPIKIRFIELMPIGCAENFIGVPTSEIFKVIEENFGNMIPIDEKDQLHGPARYFKIENFIGQIGFIDALEHKFCNSCNRIRLTAEGFLKPCLNFGIGLDLRNLLRSNCDDQMILSAIQQTIYNKPREHLFNEINDLRDERKMYQVGG